MTCWTDTDPGPDHCTETGFAALEPTIVPPVTVHKRVNPGPEVVAVYWYVPPGQITCGPVTDTAGGTVATVTVMLALGLQ